MREPDSSGEARFRRERADLDAVFRAHHAEIVRYLAARLGSRHDADDLAGEVFLAAVGSVPRLRWQGRPVLAWLYRVAGNMAADRMSQRGRETPTAAPPVEPEAVASSFEQRDALARAMRRLPVDQALAVHLRLVEDYSFVEVGRLLGRSPAACQMLVLRAARSLQSSLREEGIHA